MKMRTSVCSEDFPDPPRNLYSGHAGEGEVDDGEMGFDLDRCSQCVPSIARFSNNLPAGMLLQNRS